VLARVEQHVCSSFIQAFVEYQQQKMTSDFVEQFGFSEEDFAEQEECIGSAAA